MPVSQFKSRIKSGLRIKTLLCRNQRRPKHIPIRFFIEDLVFEFVFIDDKSTIEQNVEGHPIDGQKSLRLIFKNFNNSLGTGNLKPLPLGFIRNKSLLLNYRIYALNGDPDKGEVGKTFHYTWLLKDKEEKDGKN